MCVCVCGCVRACGCLCERVSVCVCVRQCGTPLPNDQSALRGNSDCYGADCYSCSFNSHIHNQATAINRAAELGNAMSGADFSVEETQHSSLRIMRLKIMIIVAVNKTPAPSYRVFCFPPCDRQILTALHLSVSTVCHLPPQRSNILCKPWRWTFVIRTHPCR